MHQAFSVLREGGVVIELIGEVPWSTAAQPVLTNMVSAGGVLFN